MTSANLTSRHTDEVRNWVLATIICLFSSLFLVVGILGSWGLSPTASGLLENGALLAAHTLLWWQVVRGGWVLLRTEQDSTALLLTAAVLLLALLGFQVLCLALWLSPPTLDTGPPLMQF